MPRRLERLGLDPGLALRYARLDSAEEREPALGANASE